MTNSELDALSAAATQARAEYEAAPIGQDKLAAMMATRRAFTSALEAEWHKGNLIQIDREGMREALNQVYDAARWDIARDSAIDAALAAILGCE